MLKPLILTLAFVFPASALANNCPNAKTAKQGFVLERQGTKAEVRPASDHFVHVTNLYPNGKKQNVIYYKGLFQVSRTDDTAQSISIPVSDVRTIFPLALKARRAVTYAPATPSTVGALVSLELMVTDQEEIELGPCAYEVFAVHHRYLNADGKTTSEHTDLYSPDLGFVLAKRYPNKNGSQTLVRYDSIKPFAR
ncbi:hypothetical protein MHY87_16220 [Microvirga sp. ACRRW]|uniref:hypothetical protein n=1 Tax=Microvirga sp. ACRRW TaxID=2918205 RepID=UPI001EF6018F|nr:hypothetical protein [Microvirga sp. ACRRW]MCG7394451.1 hypothetical protein [Microvirga sp. ACRRW]